MYQFIDVNEIAEDALPTEALQMNGVYLEHQIEGYRTLHVAGREALSAELTTYETGVRDGSRLQSKRYPARTITVTYRIAASSAAAFREAYNQLGKCLNVTDAELIFNDEPDQFFTGSPAKIGEVEPGTNTATGSFELLCLDPFKYSVVEYEAESMLADGSILIDYQGTQEAYPTLEARFYDEDDASADGESLGTLTGAGDCGFVAFFNECEKIIQLGNPTEEDGEQAYAKSQTLLNQKFMTTTAWGTAAKKLWTANNASYIQPSGAAQTGSVGIKAASYLAPLGGLTPVITTTLLSKKKSTSSTPNFYYTVSAEAYTRTATTAEIRVSITTALSTATAYFGVGYGLKGALYLGGAWREVTIKKTSEFWKGNSGHTANLSFTVTGLLANTVSLTGIKFKVTRTDGNGTAGVLSETACKNMAISNYSPPIPASYTYYLTAASYGTAADIYHGPSITRTLPADAKGEVGATNFSLTYRQKMCISSDGTNQIGAFQVQLTDENGGSVAGVRIVKNKVGKSANLRLYVKGEKVLDSPIDLSYNNRSFGAEESAVKTSTILKSGSKITFHIGGVVRVFSNAAIARVKVTKATFMFEQFAALPTLAYNGLYWAKFVKTNCDTYQDVPNKFSANDVVVADCRDSEVYLNGVRSPNLGALGNDWETFRLLPGLNQIGVAYSEWVAKEYAPTFKIRYREVFL